MDPRWSLPHRAATAQLMVTSLLHNLIVAVACCCDRLATIGVRVDRSGIQASILPIEESSGH